MLKRCALSLAVLLCACGGAESTPDQTGQTDELIQAGTPHLLPLDQGGPGNTAAATHLDYYGGRVLANVEVVAVFWGASVNGEVMNEMPGFYSAVTQSSYFDWLSEYDTDRAAVSGDPGTQQKIGRGSLKGAFTISPKHDGTSVTDALIERELSAQIKAGKLPKPSADTIYLISFPPGVQIDLGGSRSCESGGFCAYHSTFKRGGKTIAYGVLPDFGAGSGCDTGCGHASRQFDNQTAVASHELIEAVTDADVGLGGNTIGPPLAWYDAKRGEIGDVCNARQGKLRTKGGKSFVIQKEWSNKARACIASRGKGGASDEALEE